MKKLFILSFLASITLIAQEKMSIKHQEWELKSFKENSVLISEQEGIWLDNISKPEISLYKAKGNSITDKAMIICPGGGLFFSAYEKEGVKLAKKLAQNGITAVILKYRTYPRKGSVIKWSQTLWDKPQMAIDSAKIILPYSSKDALSAIELIRNNASKYNINPNKIGLMGFSAGGAVTMEAAYTSVIKNQPNFIAPIYPWMDIVDNQKVPLNKPPAFVSCANDDPLELAAPSVQIYQDWILAGAEAELHMFSKGGHGYGMNKINAPVDRWSQLLIDWILAL
ncbi:MAG: 1,4-beta-xylanase [Flavobacteriaceae bacterium]|nr:1,4-beta-xylanase [Flavobacteriaceae bacterium]|tara:strand:+ start:317 stop:1162 length:846 start_codon:yes stop_codon:yes gene_type:complete